MFVLANVRKYSLSAAAPLIEEVGPQAARTLERLLHLPALDAGGMAAQQHLGHRPALVLGGAGVDGWRQEVVLEGI